MELVLFCMKELTCVSKTSYLYYLNELKAFRLMPISTFLDGENRLNLVTTPIFINK